MDNRKQIFTVIILAVLAVVLVLVVSRPRRGHVPPPLPGPLPGDATKPAVPPGREPAPAAADGKTSPPKPTPRTGENRAETGAPKAGPEDAPPPAGAGVDWKPQPIADFTPADLDRVGEGVEVRLGEYRVAPNEAFDILIRLTSPPLESATIMLTYDPEMLTVFADGARPIGSFFRRGIECYVDEQAGRVVLIHTGPPGKKNTNAAAGEPVIALRVRAGTTAGETAITLDPGSSFTTGRGGDEKYTAHGGNIQIGQAGAK